MPEDVDTSRPPTVDELRSIRDARAREELRAADALAPGSDRVAWRGAVSAPVAVVKGLPGPAEASGGAAMSGVDRTALDKALTALGWDRAEVFHTLSRPEPSMDRDSLEARIRLQLEAVDPRVVIALDDEAATDVAAAFGLDALKPGAPRRAYGRVLVALGGFEASLADDRRKRLVWSQLKAAAPPGPLY